MPDDYQKSFLEKMRDLIPFFTSMLMIAGISFTYYTYFYDVQKIPQIVFDCNISKIDETQNYYIIKIIMKFKNQSKSKVEMVGNQVKLYALRCKLYETGSGEKNFMSRLMDSVEFRHSNSETSAVDINKFIECNEKELISFYQPIANASWFLPEENTVSEYISAVPKTFDKVSVEMRMDYALSENGIVTKYEKNTNGEMDYFVYVLDSKDSTETHRLSYFDDRDKDIIKKNTHIVSSMNSQMWLSGTNAIKNTLKKYQSDSLR